MKTPSEIGNAHRPQRLLYPYCTKKYTIVGKQSLSFSLLVNVYLMDPEREFNHLYERISNIMKLTYEEKRNECDRVLSFLLPLFIVTDISQDIFLTKQADIPFYISSLTLRAYLEFLINLLQGAYHSAARSLRWLYEINLAGTAACVDPSLLDPRFSGEKMNLDEFKEWLRQYDNRVKTLNRQRIFEAFKVSEEKRQELDGLYRDLCKYVHISERSFDKKMTWPNPQYLPEKFDEVFAISMKTIDLIFWLECKMLLQFNEGTKEALRKLCKDLSTLTSSIPMTMDLLSSLR